jgi:hypothetical protein
MAAASGGASAEMGADEPMNRSASSRSDDIPGPSRGKDRPGAVSPLDVPKSIAATSSALVSQRNTGAGRAGVRYG